MAFGRGPDDDLLPDTRDAGKCCGCTREQLRVIADRARSWEEAFPDVEAVLDEALSLVERMLARSVLEIDRVK
ncbi:hypothetical protein ACLMJV_13865 [Sinorhizobium meliloti]|uniref:hypothetical protein n=1 Tax=Sinorhizobium TaxID=28105 RepID=UPI0023D816D7|nr:MULTISPECIES: hypothetical protein [unclassified Sinorhizobium]WEJ13101.1 hypothetical protein N0Q90_23875 [Sinorhizobium sp. M103]WEJ18187.1 hypothetical protein N0Q91_29770 [Sinorhizobium sp. K101]WEJ39864.1 hypothetical protein N0R80_22315 [Sinorhizobium sp. C101]